MKHKATTIVFATAAALLFSCAGNDPNGGIRRTPTGDGPVVDWDVFARPLPEIPFPNDIATYPDPSSPTGKRINASMVGPTGLETRVRHQLDRLDGFGTYSQIWVSFDKQLDIENIRARHKDDGNLSDDAFYVINIDPDSPEYGKAALLDVGWGNFPVALEKKKWFENDYRANGSNLLYEDQDEVGMGRDTNFDGHLAKSNVYPVDGDPVDDLLTFYEMDTDSLIVQPVIPLREQTEYAVVLTERLVGTDGEPVRSPFPYVNHVNQSKSLQRLVDDGLLERQGLTVNDVAFAWSFTTQSTTADLVAIRRGLEGYGTFDWLQDAYPANMASIDALKNTPGVGNVYVASGAYVAALLEDYGAELLGMNDAQLQRMLDGLAALDYIVAGTYTTPNFLANDEEVFMIDRLKGTGKIGEDTVTWLMTIPKAANGFQAPFPVAYIAHGYTSSRLELLGHAATFSRFGFAAIAVDGWGHGGGDIGFDPGGLHYILDQYNLGPFVDNVIFKGRARDLNGDGIPDSGGDFWTSDALHTRDVVRQYAIDFMQLTRILRSWDGQKHWDFDLDGDGQLDVAGDFNGDGVPDTGGPWNTYFMTGGSLGGIMSGLTPAVEPYITAAAPVSGAGGLIQVGLRTTQGGVNQAVLLRIVGPLVITYPEGNDTVVAFHASDVNDDVVLPFAHIPNAAPGDYMEIFNHKTGETSFAILDADRRSRFSVESDAGDPLTITLYTGGDKSTGPVKKVLDTFEDRVIYQGKEFAPDSPLVSLHAGHGVKRQTPRFRRFMSVVGMAIEPGDPISYARHFFLEPLPILPDGPRTTQVLHIPTIGDTNVPIATGLAMARTAGLVPLTSAEANDSRYRYGRPTLDYQNAGGFETWYGSRPGWNQFVNSSATLSVDATPNSILIDNYVVEGVDKIHRFGDQDILFDPDDLDEGLDGFNAPSLDPPLRITRRTSDGISAVRMPYMQPTGQHGFGSPSPDKTFDIDSYMHNMLGHYGRSGGKELVEDLCLEDWSCGFLPQLLPRHERPSDVPPPVN